MKTLNYDLTDGANDNLITRKVKGSELLFQMWYTGVVAANVSVEAWISTVEEGPYAKIIDGEKTIVGADNTVYLSLSGVNGGWVRFKLTVPTADTAGTITKADVLT